METREPGRQCTVYFTAQQPPSVLVIPGTTVAGTTFSTVINQQTFATTATAVEGGTGYAYSQNVITTTTTRVVTVQPTTVTTEVTVSGTTGTVTLEIPGFLLIMETREPGRQCTVYFTAQQPPSVWVIPGTTFAGTTFSTVINQQTFATTATAVEGGTTVTTTGMETVQIATQGITMPIWGVGREFCERVTVTDIITYIVQTVPATVRVAFEGFTFAGTTVSLELPDLGITTTLTLTKTITGTTERFTTSFPGTSYTTVQVVQPTTYRETVTRPGTTYIETYTTVITLTETPTRTTPTATTTAQTTPTQTTAVATPTPTQTAATPPAGLPLDLLVPAIALAVIIVVAVFALRLRR
jgi:hypothetical protein